MSGHTLSPSAGSKSGQKFTVGNGERVENRGQIRLRTKNKDNTGSILATNFQVAEITRPLMSVGKICDQDLVCIFEKTHARIADQKGHTVARFERDGGLYTCTMRLKKPGETDNKSGFTRQDR